MTALRMQSLCLSADRGEQYRRRARRLRHALRNQPSRLHRSLARLASQMNYSPPAAASSSTLPTSPAAQRFESIVRQAMKESPIRYSQRLALLKTAAAIGVSPFEANLILAIEQNRVCASAVDQPSRNWSSVLTILCV